MPSGLFAHITPGLQHSLLGIDIMCDKDCKVLSAKRRITIFDKNGKTFLTGWRELAGSKLWRISLKPDLDATESCSPPNTIGQQQKAALKAYIAYNLPLVEALVGYFHATVGYPVRDMWFEATKAGNYSTLPGLTLVNTITYFPSTDDTIKGHMVQTQRNVRFTRLCSQPNDVSDIRDQFQNTSYGQKSATPDDDIEPPPSSDGACHLRVETVHQSKVCTDDTVRFPPRARSGNQYVMVIYHSSNAILVQPFKSIKDTHRLEAYNAIIQCLKDRNLLMDLQIFDSECSKEYK